MSFHRGVIDNLEMKQGAVSTTCNKVQSFSKMILLKMEILNCVSLLEAKTQHQ